MPRVYASRAYHAAFPAEHAALEHPDRLLFLASLEGKDHFAHAHPGEPSCRACRTARAARHALVHIRFEFVEPRESAAVNLVEIDRGTWCYAESENHGYRDSMKLWMSRAAERASARVSGTVLGPVQAPA